MGKEQREKGWNIVNRIKCFKILIFQFYPYYINPNFWTTLTCVEKNAIEKVWLRRVRSFQATFWFNEVIIPVKAFSINLYYVLLGLAWKELLTIAYQKKKKTKSWLLAKWGLRDRESQSTIQFFFFHILCRYVYQIFFTKLNCFKVYLFLFIKYSILPIKKSTQFLLSFHIGGHILYFRRLHMYLNYLWFYFFVIQWSVGN